MRQDLIAIEASRIDASNKKQYNVYATGKAGGRNVDSFDIMKLTPEERYELCEEFIKSHEEDHFKVGIDIVYVDDDAFPDDFHHTNYQRRNQYDENKYDYNVIVAERKLKEANEEANETRKQQITPKPKCTIDTNKLIEIANARLNE